MTGITISIIFEESDSGGEICSICKQEIKGKKWEMLLDYGDPVNMPPSPLGQVYCVICKLHFENES